MGRDRRLLIRNGVLALPAGPMRADLLCEGHRIVAIGRELHSEGAIEFDATELTAGPGFVDIHVHGGGGQSFFIGDPGQVIAYAEWAPRNGVTSFLISTIGDDDLRTIEMLQMLAPTVGTPDHAEPLGFHLEGPFISPARKGAFHDEHLRIPASSEYDRYQEAAGGLIRQVTLAPELAGGLGLATVIALSGAVSAMGHTDATAEQARRSFECGISHVTHLFNAMRPIHHREGGAAVASLLDGNVTCELICDGAHLSADTIRLAYRILGPNRTVVVTDNLSIAGTEMRTGSFNTDPIKVRGAAAIRKDGTLVGSVATMDRHFRNAVAFLEIDLPTAFRLCSTNPARVAGVSHRKGALAHGMDADIVLVDASLEVAATICRGQVAYLRDPIRFH
ncbi:MAG TPA: N-acetylglucosamine-6-phosphate deacetylase [Tepidiformaceae bacterium]